MSRQNTAFGRILTDIFTINRSTSCILTHIIIQVHIFKKAAACKIPHTACLAVDIQFLRQTACFIIKRIHIIRIADTHIPQNHRRVIAILHNHLPDISHCNLFPASIPHKLPSRYFRDNQKTDFITSIHKIL